MPAAASAATAKAVTAAKAAAKASKHMGQRSWFKHAPQLHSRPQAIDQPPQQIPGTPSADSTTPPIDGTVKLFIAGKVPHSGYSTPVHAADGRLLGRGPARQSQRHSQRRRSLPQSHNLSTAHTRAQVLYYIAENLSQRREEIANRLAERGKNKAEAEVSTSIERITYAAWADKYEGTVHNPPFRSVTLAMQEPIGTIGILSPQEAPLLGFVSAVMPP